MTTEELLICIRAACAPWVETSVGRTDGKAVVRKLSNEFRRIANDDVGLLRTVHARITGEQKRTELDCWAFAVVECALASLCTHEEQVQAAAFGALFLASCELRGEYQPHVINLATIYDSFVLVAAVSHLHSHRPPRAVPVLLERAQELLTHATCVAARKGAS